MYVKFCSVTSVFYLFFPFIPQVNERESREKRGGRGRKFKRLANYRIARMYLNRCRSNFNGVYVAMGNWRSKEEYMVEVWSSQTSNDFAWL